MTTASLDALETAIETIDLSKEFDELTAVDNVNLQIPKGKIFGFIGPSGCGKTTTMRLLLGIYKPTSGEAKILGNSPKSFGRKEREKIGYMPQLFVLYPNLTIWENLNFAASLYGVSLRRKERLNELLEFVELKGHEHKMVRNISGGMQRRLSLAAALVHDPTLIFLDEPTAGIDPVLRRKFWDHFRALQQRGHTLFISTQYVGEAAYCDYVGVMNEGRLLFVETPIGLRRQAMGGDIVLIHPEPAIKGEQLLELKQHPLVKNGQAELVDDDTLRIIVEDAGTAMPILLNWVEEQGSEVKTAQEFQPPFDDVFVQIIENTKKTE